ncbi:DEAD/DEAH box helicase family protein [Bradyrhizobium sp. RT4b]|uniref:DEAD/DEAH box helicase family protein n=1 Tax=Bradyrhizobium sp. RT4b TaxID=3156379 RepID=UPI00339A3F57
MVGKRREVPLERDGGLRAALAAAGGEGPLARALGIAVPSLRDWRRVPAHRIMQVEAVTGVSREILRPDLYGPQPDAVPKIGPQAVISTNYDYLVELLGVIDQTLGEERPINADITLRLGRLKMEIDKALRIAGPAAKPKVSQTANYHANASTADDKQQRLIKGNGDPFLPHLILHMDQADVCDIAVAFLLDSGARLIAEHLKDFLDRGGRARILVSNYLDVTEPIALRRLADLGGDLCLKVYEAKSLGFNLKSYLFMKQSEGVAFVGSSNLSEAALTTSVEWNYKIISSHDERGFQEIREGFDLLFHSPASVPASDEWIEHYEQRRIIPIFGGSGVADEPPQPPPKPHAIQLQALAELEQTRNDGFTAGLAVLATGLGKTWLAAFDSTRPDFQRLLFVAPREEVVNQAIQVFRRLRPTARIGRLAEDHLETDSDLVFASVQTLDRIPHLSRFSPSDFDYIVIDEFHHAAAKAYRRVIDYFQPKFLLGLTATLDRTDGANLLTLCQENLVFEAGICNGIGGGLLCPFHYFGVGDDVDYSNIPWRNSQFDEAELTIAIATEAHARNSLDQVRKHGGSRCIAFCCSQRHADFMAGFFVQEGVRAVAVHSGLNGAPRATSLEQLRDGKLDIIFAVDTFDEGVDVPSIDTVLMLRPTESTITWLKQLGRGLRTSDEKEKLIVIDYIGDHRVFLTKLQGMAVLIGRESESADRQREILEAIRDNTIALPAGCDVTYETRAFDILRHLLRPERTEEVLAAFYRDFEGRNGTRPTAVEVYHAGLNPGVNSERSWLTFVDRMGGLEGGQLTVWLAARDFLTDIEKTEITQSYKIILLLAMLDDDTLVPKMSIGEIARRVSKLTERMHGLAGDFSVAPINLAQLEKLLIENSIKAFTGAQGMGRVPYFTFDRGTFAFALEIADRSAFGSLLREVLDWRLAQYLSRAHVTDVVCRVARDTTGNPILFLPSDAQRRRLPEGPLDVEVDGRAMQVLVTKIAVNVLRESGATTNELASILRRWFGEDAGLPSRSDRVRFRKGPPFILEPL